MMRSTIGTDFKSFLAYLNMFAFLYMLSKNFVVFVQFWICFCCFFLFPGFFFLFVFCFIYKKILVWYVSMFVCKICSVEFVLSSLWGFYLFRNFVNSKLVLSCFCNFPSLAFNTLFQHLLNDYSHRESIWLPNMFLVDCFLFNPFNNLFFVY